MICIVSILFLSPQHVRYVQRTYNMDGCPQFSNSADCWYTKQQQHQSIPYYNVLYTFLAFQYDTKRSAIHAVKHHQLDVDTQYWPFSFVSGTTRPGPGQSGCSAHSHNCHLILLRGNYYYYYKIRGTYCRFEGDQRRETRRGALEETLEIIAIIGTERANDSDYCSMSLRFLRFEMYLCDDEQMKELRKRDS